MNDQTTDPMAELDLSPAQRAAVERWQEAMQHLEQEMTQREWLQITARLDRPRVQIAEDPHLRLTALAWVKRVREHGGQRWDELLDYTDAQVLAALDFPEDLADDDSPAPGPAAE